MKRELESMGELASDQSKFFTAYSPTQTQFGIWRKNLFVPLADQLEEHAQRKLEERDEMLFRK